MSHANLIVMLAALAISASLGCQSQRRFASPSDAVAALSVATEKRDKAELRAIFGPRMAELRSGDPDQDEIDFASFRRTLGAGHEIEPSGDDAAILLIGPERWPFAVPLVRDRSEWRFDTNAGVDELMNRRIGRNELRTIAACRTLITAQGEYRAADRNGDGVLEYAQRLTSTPGTKDGLYWPAPGGIDPSPIGPVLAQAATRTDARGSRVPFNGYSYRGLDRQGPHATDGAMNYREGNRLTRGWAVIAWPHEYDRTGVMTFVVSHTGQIFEANLGDDTEQAVAEIDTFDPDPAVWTLVQP